jgi:4-azaleucine resistance transporter AzlC
MGYAFAMDSHSRRSEFWRGARDTFPLIVGAAPFGIIYGALAIGAGLSPWAAQAMSLFVFAGSAQFIAVGLLAGGAALPLILLTTAVVNLRHALYAASLAPYMRGWPQRWLVPLGFWLTDETYAVVIRRYANEDPAPHGRWYQLGSSLAMYANWQLCTLIGIVAGAQLVGLAELGLDFAMAVTFIGIVVPLLTTRPMLAAAAVAGVVALLAHGLPSQFGLIIAAVAGIAAGVLADAWAPQRKGPAHE